MINDQNRNLVDFTISVKIQLSQKQTEDNSGNIADAKEQKYRGKIAFINNFLRIKQKIFIMIKIFKH